MPQNRISICTSCWVGSRRSIVVPANGDVALETAYALALDMEAPSLGIGDEQIARRTDYETGPTRRYPDPANLLPISVAARIFVHEFVNSALTWSGGATAVKSTKLKDVASEQNLVSMRTELARRVAARAVAEGDALTDISGLRLYRRSVPTACTSATYEPSLVLFLQGQKRINVGKTVYVCDGSNFLLTSVDLPVVSQVIAATEKEPLLGLILKLEMPA